MKKLTLLPLFLLTLSVSFSQNFEWVAGFQGTQSVIPFRFAEDNSLNLVYTCWFKDSLDLDPGPGMAWAVSLNEDASIIAKYDAAGNYLWHKMIAGSDEVHVRTVATDKDKNILMAGDFRGTADFDPGAGMDNHTAAGTQDFFVAKYDSNGNHLWAHGFGSTEDPAGFEPAFGIGVDSAGNSYITGSIKGPADFDPGPGNFTLAPNTSFPAFVMSLDPAGGLRWAFLIEESLMRDIAVDDAGDFVVSGEFSNTTDIDPGPGVMNMTPNTNAWDLLLVKYDAAGNLLWGQQSDGGGQNATIQSQGVEFDLSGNVLVTGRYSDSIDFKPGGGINSQISNGSFDAFLAKYDSAGNYKWAFGAGGSDTEESTGVEADSSGNVYFIGFFRDTMDLDPGPDTAMFITPNNRIHTYIGKYDSVGNYIWGFTLGNSGSGIGKDIHYSPSGSIYINGRFSSDTIDFDPGPGMELIESPVGSPYAYLAKYGTSILVSAEPEFPAPAEKQFTLYPNPNQGDFRLELNPGIIGRREFVLYNSLGNVVFRQQVLSNQEADIQVGGLSSGVYQGCLIGEAVKECYRILVW